VNADRSAFTPGRRVCVLRASAALPDPAVGFGVDDYLRECRVNDLLA
jgi:hypothetical protein